MSYLTRATLGALAARLDERDRAVLVYVSALRFVSGDQLARLCFADNADPTVDARPARRALLRLVRLGVLARLPRPVGGVRAGSAGFVYRLDLAGQRLAHGFEKQPERRTRRSAVPGTLFVRHALAVAELHTRLVEADRSGHIELLELASEPSCWRDIDGAHFQRLKLKPDSYVRFGCGDYEHSYFIEVDRGSEGSRAIERQLAAYGAYYESGIEQEQRGVFPRVLWLVPDDGRAGVIEDCAERLPSDQRELFAVAPFKDALGLMLSPNYPSNEPPSLA